MEKYMSAVTFETPDSRQRVHMHNRNISEEEIEILKNDKSPAYPLGRYFKIPYIQPCEEPEIIGGSY
jgi:hypothetical protein